MKLSNSILLLISLLFFSCTLEKNNQLIKSSKIITPEKKINENNLNKKFIPIYFIGDPYFIDDIQYIPEENYNYNKTGLASFYGSELHRKLTINKEFNKVTELLARHKTLPLPSVVKITNLENGLSLIVRVNDRGPNTNTRIIQVSRKVAQLLRFYKSKVARVRVELLSDPSKQVKVVTESMSDSDFDKTLDAVPTEDVKISDLDNNLDLEAPNEEISIQKPYEQPVELGFEEISKADLFIKIDGFSSYQEAKNVKDIISETYNFTTQKEKKGYSIIFGPLLNEDADNLFQILVSKGYKETEIIVE
tara:strand:- start:167 stop:1084 length:918 start_codon:yes stop_codon:yes gene_type:complete